MDIKTKMSIQMAMRNSDNKGIRQLGIRHARRKKNPWKERERDIWKNRHNCRVINKPEDKKVVLPPEQKARDIQVKVYIICRI